MAFELENRLSLKVLFGEEEFLFDRANSLDFLHMSCSTRVGVPMLHMAVQDNIDSLRESKHFSDAAKIQIVIKAKDDTFATTYAFRLNSYRRTASSGGYRYELDAYVDANTYWHASSVVPKKGSSYSAIKGIAEDCGLKFEGDQTVDTQLWIPRNIPYHEWARQISERGYRSDKSFMQLGLNFDKTLVYRDLSAKAAPKAKFAFAEYVAGFITTTDVQPSTSSGSMNHYSGYAETHVEQDVETATLHRSNSKVEIDKKASEGTMMINSKIKNAVKQARVTFAPIDIGNVHPAYEQALYQNRRQNNMFNVRLDLVANSATKLHLLDLVTVNLDSASDYLKTYSGDYHIASRVVFIKGFEYFEKFELVRKTMNINLKDSVG